MPVRPDEEMEIVRLYREERLTGAQIAERTGRSKQTVYTVLRSNHVPLHRQEGSIPDPQRATGDFLVPPTQEALMARYSLVTLLDELVYATKRVEALEAYVRELGGDPENPMHVQIESPALRRARIRAEAKAPPADERRSSRPRR